MAERHALVIGIGQYQHYQYLSNLDSVTNDVEAIACILDINTGGLYRVERYPYRYIEAENRYEMKNGEAKKETLLEKIDTFLFKTARNSDALIYFSGHGLQFRESEHLDYKGGLAAYDTQKDGTNLILFSTLNQLFQKARNKAHLSSLVVILDCCHAGLMTEEDISYGVKFIDKDIIENDFSSFTKESGYALLASCRSHQASYCSQGMSDFTRRIIEGLKSEKADENGRITITDLAKYVYFELTNQEQYSSDLCKNAAGIIIAQYDKKESVKNQDKLEFLDHLSKLNFNIEDGHFKTVLEQDIPIGAFLIQSQVGGQLWLLERFWRSQQEKLFCDAVNYPLYIKKKYSFETLWCRFHSNFETNNDYLSVIEEIYSHWFNSKPTVLSLIGIEKLDHGVIQQFLENLWIPLSKKAIHQPSAYPLLLFLVDTGYDSQSQFSFKNCTKNDNFCAEIHFQFIINPLSNKVIEKWINDHSIFLNSYLIQRRLSIDDFKQKVMELHQKEDTCIDDTIETICQLCNVNFHQNRKFYY